MRNAFVNKILRKFGIEVKRYSPSIYEKVVTLGSGKSPKGHVLLSYLIKPFLVKSEAHVPTSHTNHWRCLQIAKILLDLGYAVDVIDSHNQTFEPTKSYALFIGHRINFDRIAMLLNSDCIKIAHLDTAHWIYNNYATYRRKLELQQRRGVTIKGSDRIVEHTLASEHADYVTVCGNDFNINTFGYLNRQIYTLPQTPAVLYPWPEQKDHGACRMNFLWFGSHGFVHKGLDLALEAFAEMPDYHLYVCGPLGKEPDFVKAYEQELYRTSNIHPIGWVDVESPKFVTIVNQCLGVVNPSCSEAGGGNVIVCMHAGLIPLVSYESSVDVHDYGVMFRDNAVDTIKEAVRMVSRFPSEQLSRMSRKAWEFARDNHTRGKFSAEYKKLIVDIMAKTPGKNVEGNVGCGCDSRAADSIALS
jgi:glycosyltransferase involved in cell wall biosynthesis